MLQGDRDHSRAIETEYRGYRFRSRLEARWAVFFDTLQVRWEYEKDGYELELKPGASTRYLPDFFLPEPGCFIEIKPTYPSEIEQQYAQLLATATDRVVYIFYGAIPFPLSEDGHGMNTALKFWPSGGMDDGSQWCMCTRCGTTNIGIYGQFNLQAQCPCFSSAEGPDYQPWTGGIVDACTRARSARFEFGETP